MKLKDKFKIINCKDCDIPYCDTKCTILAPSELIKLEQVADEFAIGFSEWKDNNCIYYFGWRILLGNKYINVYNNKEYSEHIIKY